MYVITSSAYSYLLRPVLWPFEVTVRAINPRKCTFIRERFCFILIVLHYMLVQEYILSLLHNFHCCDELMWLSKRAFLVKCFFKCFLSKPTKVHDHIDDELLCVITKQQRVYLLLVSCQSVVLCV